MKKLSFLLLTGTLFALSSCAQWNWGKVRDEAEKVLNNSKPLTNDEIIQGLKEALVIGSQNSASLASKVDAYYKNPKLFIPFPPEAIKAEQKLRELGLGKKVDEFIVTLNRAAEEAAKEAAPIFVNAVKQMTIKDAANILNGADNAATMYLKNTTSTELMTKFKPVIARALDKVTATKYWADIINTYNQIPLVTKLNPDLPGYATGKAIDGLFILVANEELKIRKDPAARVTEILRRVFGKRV